MDPVSILLNPQVIAILGPVGVILVIGIVVLYRLYVAKNKQYDELQEKRVAENKTMQQDYDVLQEKRVVEAQKMQQDFLEFSLEMSRTLDAVLKALRKGKGD